MKFLVLGASGMAGHVISIYLSEQGHDVTGFCRKPVDFVKCIVGDAMNSAFLEASIRDGEYDVVINAIGLLVKEADNRKDLAVYLNSYLPHFLAMVTRGTKTRVFQMSTDCVFAGNSGPYTEDSFPDGSLFYDRSKALGELVDDKNLTFRNSIIGPDITESGVGLLNWFMKQDGPISGYSKAMWTGLSTLELAKAMEHAALRPVSGLVNMVPSGNISKYELLKLFNRHLRADKVLIEPSSTLVLDKSLTRTNYDCDYVPAPYESQISELAEWIMSHRHLYPHYELG